MINNNMFLKGIFVGLVVIAATSGCATTRTKTTDKAMRVMVDPRLGAETTMEIQTALIQNDAFTVVDRSKGYAVIKQEQDRTQKEEVDRFEDKEKWSHIGKMYGVGAVVVGSSKCTVESSFINRMKRFKRCSQILSIIDANTGEIITSVKNKVDGESSYSFPEDASWDDTVLALVESFPKTFKQSTESLEKFKEESEKHALKQKELAKASTPKGDKNE